ncbi:MAG: response regulator [Solirubrobacteraceae bacterium]
MTSPRLSRPLEVLLVEDNPADVRLTTEVLRDAATPTRLHVACDGEQGIEVIRELGSDRRLDLVVLDYNLPRKSGLEVLRECKADPALRRIPVVMLSGSGDDRDVQRCYELHANAYVTKPVEFDRFNEVIRAVERFWLGIATLPSE